jgi:hypothetical protein
MSSHLALFNEISFVFIVDNSIIKKSFNFQIIIYVFIYIVYLIVDFIMLILLLKLKSKNPIMVGIITFFFGFLDFINIEIFSL